MLRYAVKMGRPKEHDAQTRRALLAAAERLVDEGGPDALSLRRTAELAGTTTRAVYSLFGSKDGLLVAVAQQAFAYLESGLKAAKESADPAADLVELGAGMYRRFVRTHPSVFRLAFQRIAPGLPMSQEFFDARARCWAVLESKVRRLADAGLLGGRTVTEAAVQFNALCEGLGNAELRGGTLAPGNQAAVWRGAFGSLVQGFASPPSSLEGRRRRAKART